MRTVKTSFFLCCLFFIASCGSGGGESSSDAAQALTADFVAASPGSQSGSVTLQKNRVSGDIVYVDVKVTNISGAFGADLKLDFDSSKVKWAGGYEAGDFLEQGGTPQYWQNSTGDEFTITLLAGQGAEVSGSGVLITVPFKVLASGEANINFNSDSKITDSTAPIPTSVSVSLWSGGTVKGY